ncbi:MAG: CPBP family intramembrane metalloprotease [Chloracidobacterium sp.]|nr:CPBP family intramembrane metalloprotease [Chloracidobacterium sp.]
MKSSYFLFDAIGRLRSGWRAAIYVGLFVFGGVILGSAVLIIVGPQMASAGEGSPVGLLINSLISLAVALAAGWFCGKYLEKLPFRAMGASLVKGWGSGLIIGLVLGFMAIATAALIGLAAGGLSFRLNADAASGEVLTTAAISFAVFTVAAAFEEVLFRGYLLQTFIRSNLTWLGLLLTSVLFATVHNANPSATWLSWLNTIIAGAWFGLAYLRTRNLWLPFGLHLAWNWAQGSIFGIEVSGLKELVPHPLLKEIDSGPDWLTGGQYGLEGGLLATAALAVSMVIVWYFPGLFANEELIALNQVDSGQVKTIDSVTEPS